MCALASMNLSDKAVDFIDDDYLSCLLQAGRADMSLVREIIAKSLEKKPLSLAETACLLSVDEPTKAALPRATDARDLMIIFLASAENLPALEASKSNFISLGAAFAVAITCSTMSSALAWSWSPIHMMPSIPSSPR